GLPDGCPLRIEPHFSWSMRNFPRDSFDYVWLMDPVKFDPRLLSGMHLIWQDGPYMLYHVDDHRPLEQQLAEKQ
ncbi:MAG: hypothetical protein KGQ42_07055, partial [Alphaproteobacteria bacterium]|nr:hypothetical protein [Alphaproteobacteria bacterium]